MKLSKQLKSITFLSALLLASNHAGAPAVSKQPSIASTSNNLKWFRLIEAGDKAEREKDWRTARSTLNKALAVLSATATDDDPRLTVTWRYLGDACMGQFDLRAARQCFENEAKLLKQLSDSHPGLPYDYYQLGDIAIRQNRFNEAVSYFQSSLRIRQEFPALHLPQTNNIFSHLAIAQCLSGDLKEAEETLDAGSHGSKTDLRALPYDLVNACDYSAELLAAFGLPESHKLAELRNEFDLRCLALLNARPVVSDKQVSAYLQALQYRWNAGSNEPEVQRVLHECINHQMTARPNSGQLQVIGKALSCYLIPDASDMQTAKYLIDHIEIVADSTEQDELRTDALIAEILYYLQTHQTGKVAQVARALTDPSLINDGRLVANRAVIVDQTIERLLEHRVVEPSLALQKYAVKLEDAALNDSSCSPDRLSRLTFHRMWLARSRANELNCNLTLQQLEPAYRRYMSLPVSVRQSEPTVAFYYMQSLLRAGKLLQTEEQIEHMISLSQHGHNVDPKQLAYIQDLKKSMSALGKNDCPELATLTGDVLKAIEQRDRIRLYKLIDLFDRYKTLWDPVHAHARQFYSDIGSRLMIINMDDDAFIVLKKALEEQDLSGESTIADADKFFLLYRLALESTKISHPNVRDSVLRVHALEEFAKVNPNLLQNDSANTVNELAYATSALRTLEAKTPDVH